MAKTAKEKDDINWELIDSTLDELDKEEAEIYDNIYLGEPEDDKAE